MPSPFPGMDPFLEDDKLWPVFHHHFVASLFQTVLPNLIDRYRARVGQRCYVTEMPLFTSVLREQLVSPTNKLKTEGRVAYLERRRDARMQSASIVEIDLVMQGQPMLDYSRDGLPDWNYAITVTRCAQPERYEIYTSTLQKRLPRFKLPLAADDRDTVVDLQAAFIRCYDHSGLGAQIDYQKTPVCLTDAEDRRWLHDELVKAKLRGK